MDTAMAADGMQEEDIGSMVLSRFSDSPRSADQNLCAVVGTMCQELKERGIPLTPVAYFGAAASTLDRLTQDSSSGPDPKTKALLTFLSVVLPAVPAAAVRCKGGEVAGTLVRILGFSTLSEGSTKAALKCLALVIANGDKSNWVQGIQPRYDVLLGFVADTREKVRREAHMCLCDILRHFQGTPVLSPASERIINLLRKRSLLSKPMNDVNANISQVAGALEVLFTLNALTECLPLMTNTHKNRFLSSCTNLLKHIETPVLTRSIMAALHSLSCSSVPDTSAGNMLGLLCSISVSICGSEKSADALAATARMLHVGVKKVYDLNRSTCIEKLPLIFSTLADIMACEHEEAIFAAAEAFKGLIYSCIDDTLIQEGVDRISSNVEGGLKRSVPTLIERICISMEGLLGYQYVAVWDLSFQIISSMFDRLGESSCHLMVGVIESLANLENLSDEDLVYRKQLHECVGSAVAALGPETFLKILPLNLEYDELSKANMWLLPILKQYIVGARLSYFTESIFMVIKLVQQRSQKFESEGLIVSARTAQGIVFSLWSLLPAFCNYPSDMASSFKSLQKVLRDKLQEEPDLRGLICSSLQILIQQNKKVLEGNDEPLDEQNTFLTRAKSCYTPQLAEENFNQLRSTATSFLSVLSKIFLNSSKDTGGCLLSTIKEFACISERKSVKLFFKNTMQRLLEVTQQAITAHQSQTTSSMQIDGSSNEISLSVKRALLLDLAVSVLPGLDDKEIDFLFNCIKSTIESEEAIIQKKAYKTLSVILKERDDFFSNKLDDIFELMVTVLPSCHFSAKRHRLECLYFLIVHVIKDTSEQRKPEVMSSFLTEIILALKEGNKKTRNKAYDLLVEIAHACGDEKQGGKRENLQQFFNMVAGGLAGETPHMISAAVKGLARLTYEFSELVGAACNLLPSSLLLLQRKNREICKANLGLVKVLVAKSQVDWLNTHLKGIVEGLLSWQDSKNHFKAKMADNVVPPAEEIPQHGATTTNMRSSDPGWKYCDVPDPDRKERLRCVFCKHTSTGGIFRLKKHLACRRGDVDACMRVPAEVKREICEYLDNMAAKKAKRIQELNDAREQVNIRERSDDEEVVVLCGSGANAKKPRVVGQIDTFFRRNPEDVVKDRRLSKQESINNKLKKEERKKTLQFIARWFYQASIPMNTVTLESFNVMLEAVGQFGPGLQGPSIHELREPLLRNEVEMIKQSLEAHREEWRISGCSIMTDAWTDRRGRSIMNLCVNCKRGTSFLRAIDASADIHNAEFIFKLVDSCIEEVGAENVVQVVTDNAASNLAASRLLKDKRPGIFWTPCAAHCIDLMLEAIGQLPRVKNMIQKSRKLVIFIYSHHSTLSLMRKFTNGDLVRPGVTRFATAYLSLQSLLDKRNELRSMFCSSEWEACKYASTGEGQRFANMVTNPTFWHGMVSVVNIFKPLVNVLRLVDSEKKPTMGFIYAAMLNAEKELTANLSSSDPLFLKKVMDIVNEKWDKRLHRPLHVAGYYLNPYYYWADPDINSTQCVMRGLMECVDIFFPEMEIQDKIVLEKEMPAYRNAKDAFGKPNAIRQRSSSDLDPVEWWTNHGYETPHLQKMAIRILNLTCTSSGCERNWSTFEMVKLLLEMLIKKCGPDAVKTVMPNEHMKLLTNIRKTTERNERKVRSEKGSMCSSSTLGKSHLSKTNASRLSRWNHTHIFSDVDDGGKNDSNSELVGYDENAASRAKSSSGLRSNANLMRLKRKRKSSKSLLGDSIEDMEHGPLDLLDMQKTRSALRSSQLKSMPEDNDEFEITADGRIVITEDKRKVKKERTLSAADSDTRSQASGHTAASSGASLRGKRRKTADSGWAYTGTEYTSKKAKGDVKRKGKLEPYAYWPLDRKLLNRREESKAMARKGMATVVKMTKKLEGKSAAAALSLKGMKLKRTNRNKKHK